MSRCLLALAGTTWSRGVVTLLALVLLAGCAQEAGNDVPVRVRRVAWDPASQAPVVLLENPERGVAMPIWIGPAEAQAIAAHLAGEAAARPLTHDLMKSALERVGVGVRKVVIHALRDRTYLANLVLERDGEDVVVDSRPSDAIALAVRFGQPIYVEPELFAREAVVDLRRGVEAADAASVDGITVQALSAALASAFDLQPGAGVLVSDVAPGAGGGLQRGDVVLEVDGEPVADALEFRAKLRRGEGEAALAVYRDGRRVALALPRRAAVD